MSNELTDAELFELLDSITPRPGDVDEVLAKIHEKLNPSPPPSAIAYAPAVPKEKPAEKRKDKAR